MKVSQKKDWIAEKAWACAKAIRAVETSKRQVTSGYDGRLRKLHAFQEVLFVKESDSGQLELFDPTAHLTEELKLILEDPLHGLG